MNKAIKTLTCAALAAAVSFAVSSQAYAGDAIEGINASEVKGTITYYTNRTDLVENGTFDRYEKEFKKLYPNVEKVKVIGFADYQGGLRPRMNTGDYGDIVLILPSVPSQQYANFYEPLNGMYKPDDVYFYDTWADKDKVYGISMGNSVEGLVYNKKVLADAGVSVPIKTVTEFFEACKKIKAKGKIPFYVNFGAQWPLQQYDKYPLVIAGDANVYEDMLNQDKAFSGDTAYHKSLAFLKKVITEGYTEKDLMTNSWEDSKNTFAKGNAGMFYLGNWVIPQFEERGAKSEDIGFMPIPGDDSGVLKAQMNHDWGYAISKFSKNKETAKAYLKFLLEKSDFDKIAGFIPTLVKKEPAVPQLNEYLGYKPEIITTPVNSTKFIEVTNRSKIDFYSGGYIQDVMTASDFDEALKKLDARWNRARGGK